MGMGQVDSQQFRYSRPSHLLAQHLSSPPASPPPPRPLATAPRTTRTSAAMADELAKLDKWLAKTEERLDGGKIIKPESIVDACQALSKARELRALFEKKEKPLITAKELIGDKDPEIAALTQKCERVKKLTDFYLSKTEALCVIWASGQVNADMAAIEKALQASGSKVQMSGEDLKACVLEIQDILVK